ncbi:MAG: D-tyrosyl-tRNA(Tyr) deacylase [Desulfobulbaceae bacterium]|nr:D-tyrosyl-tRNA(Tyr) deacylase [Desulfobulbaceae bacterium]
MKAIIQLVSQASVSVNQHVVSSIGSGLLILLGIGRLDTEKEAHYLAEKIAELRIFPDHNGQMNRSVKDVDGEILVVSQFTLFGDCRKGRRPSYNQAAPPETAKHLYLYFVEYIKKFGRPVSCGQFQATMEVHLTNQGPVTIILDTDKTP